MALTFSLLTSGGSATDDTSYATASVSPSANTTLLAGFAVVDVGAALTTTTATCTGNGLTWTQVISPPGNTSNRLYVFRASSRTTPTPGALTIGTIVTAGLADGSRWAVVEIAGSDITNNDGVVQNNSGTNALTSLSITLGSAITAGNGSGGFFTGRDTAAGTIGLTVGSGYTVKGNNSGSIGSETLGTMSEWRTDGNTVVNATANANVVQMRGVAVEIYMAANPSTLNNYQFVSAGDGMSVTEKIK